MCALDHYLAVENTDCHINLAFGSIIANPESYRILHSNFAKNYRVEISPLLKFPTKYKFSDSLTVGKVLNYVLLDFLVPFNAFEFVSFGKHWNKSRKCLGSVFFQAIMYSSLGT